MYQEQWSVYLQLERKDLVSIKHALENNVDFIAVSYVRNAKDLQPAVDAIKNEGNSPQLLLRLNIQQQ